MKIGTIVGSPTEGSINRQVARALATLIGDRAEVTEILIGDLPLYDRDLEDELPDAVRTFKQDVEDVDAVIFATPEYNRAIPAALKNALEWGSRPPGENSFEGRPAGVVGASAGAIGTAVAQQQLRAILAYLDMPTLGQPEVFLEFEPDHYADDGTITDDSTREFLADWVDTYLAHVASNPRS